MTIPIIGKQWVRAHITWYPPVVGAWEDEFQTFPLGQTWTCSSLAGAYPPNSLQPLVKTEKKKLPQESSHSEIKP